jgi:hypothetical protein
MMGYRYQNKLDEENEKQYWQRHPRWKKWFYWIKRST